MGVTLIVCEKPDAALHIAEALDKSGKPLKLEKYGVPYYSVNDGKEKVIVCSALGHLYEVDAKGPNERWHYPVWDFAWKPKHLVERGQKKQELWLKAISELADEADNFINGCDYDIEGSLIGYMILKYACKGADEIAKRMKFSTLTEKELRQAYSDLMPHLDYPLVNAGMCRHEVDWVYGINLSRALTQSAYKHSGKYATLSTGRVQGPTLKFIIEREKEIATSVPLPFWVIKVKVKVDGVVVDAEYEAERLDSKDLTEDIVANCSGKKGFIEDIETKKYQLNPPHPFDLASLQAEAYRHFGFTPSQTLGIAERLYLDALVSYPRTSSQKLPPTIDYRDVIEGLSKISGYEKKAEILLSFEKLQPNEGSKVDSAHPAIYPTGKTPKRKLDSREQKIFELIVKRFMATFGRVAIKQSEKVRINVNGYIFYLRGSRMLEKGWVEFYEPYAKFEEVTLPALEVGQQVTLKEVIAEERFTQPPPRYNPSSLLRLMEEEGIGTKATRAEIVDTLYQRGYVKGERMTATPLAFKVIELLEKYCPKVIDVQFTRELEKMMESIELNKMRREDVLLEAVEHLKPVVQNLKLEEFNIGRELSQAIKEMKLSEITLSTLCPKCSSKLYVLRSRRTGKRFIGCSGMWKRKCSFSLPLPQHGKLTLLDKSCRECGFQLIQVKIKNKRPMVSCPNCFVTKLGNANKTMEKPSQDSRGLLSSVTPGGSKLN
jgi:DNA topoisomerase-1